MPPESARRALAEASLELARLRRIRGASHRTWRRIARARQRIALAAALLAAGAADPAIAADPVLVPASRLPLDLPALPSPAQSWPAFADIDGDGDFDLFVGLTNGNTVFFRNTGSALQPALALPQTNPFGLADAGTYSIPSLADLDGDGDLDVLIGVSSTVSRFFENTGTVTAPAFAASVTNPFGLSFLVWDLADIDADGDLDAFRLVSPGAEFQENTGTASAPAFAPPVANPFGLSASVSHFADLDGDGDLDGYFGTWDYTNELLVSFNTGSPSAPAFAAPVANPFDLQVLNRSRTDFADLDGDGDLDALTMGIYLEGGTSQWIENVGTATAPAFTSLGNPLGLGFRIDRYALVGYAYPFEGDSCSLGDIDGDGDLDAFSGSGFERNVGTPVAPAFEPVPIPTLDLAGIEPQLADLDGDGDPDALLGSPTGEIVFFANTGSAAEPAFAAGVSAPFGLGDFGDWSAPAIADLDADGDFDLMVGNAHGDLVHVENTGTAAAPAFAAPSASSWVGADASPALVDIDADGDLDAFVGIRNGDVLFFENTGSATAPAFVEGSPFGLDPAGSTSATTRATPDLADIDGDGDLDAFVGSAGAGVRFFRNTGTTTSPAFAPFFDAPGIGRLPGAGQRSSPHLADLDADGDLDVVVANGSGVVTYFPNAGTPTTPRIIGPSSESPFGLGGGLIELVDIDADGDLDRFLRTGWNENIGTASEARFEGFVAEPFGLVSLGSFAFPAFADLDADGDADALFGKADGTLVLFLNTGSASTPAFGAPVTNPFGLADVGSYATPALGDLDGDGDLDALVGAYDGNTRLFRNTGSAAAPAFAAPVSNPFGLRDVGLRSSPEIADVDADGDLDVIVGDQVGRLIFFENVAIDPDACQDGLDNDGDGRVDFGDDPGCASAADTSELGTLQCDNGLDDDGDGFVDAADPHCSGPLDDREAPTQASPGCGLGPELAALVPLFAALRRRRSRG